MKRLLLGTISFAALGYIYLAYAIPGFLHLFNGLSPDAILILGFFPIGIAFGYFLPKQSLAIPFLAITLLVLLAILEAAFNYRSHNLWGIELALYGYLLFTAWLGSYLGKRLSVKNNVSKYA
jgi:hypothetical protein